MEEVGYYNGRIGDLRQMTVPMLDRAVYFGDGVYDAATFAHGNIFAEKDHFERFYNSLRMLRIDDFPLTPEQLHDELRRCIDAFDGDEGFLYWQCSRGTAPRTHAFPEDATPNLMAYVVGRRPFDPSVTYDLISLEDKRYYYCNIKTLNLIPSILAFQTAKEAGCQEVVLYREGLGQRRVTEGAHSNVLIIRDGVLVAPPRDNLILPGITLKHLLMLAGQLGIPTQERPFMLEEVQEADEVLISNTGRLCTRARSLDGRPVGMRDPATARRLQEAYLDFYERDTSRPRA